MKSITQKIKYGTIMALCALPALAHAEDADGVTEAKTMIAGFVDVITQSITAGKAIMAGCILFGLVGLALALMRRGKVR